MSDFPDRYVRSLAESLARSRATSGLSGESIDLAQKLMGDRDSQTSGRWYARRNTTHVTTRHGERTDLACVDPRPNLDSAGSQGYLIPDETLFPKPKCTCKKNRTAGTASDWSSFIVRPSLGALHASSVPPAERWHESVTACMEEDCLREALKRWEEPCFMDGKTSKEDYWKEKLRGVEKAVEELDGELLGIVDLPILHKSPGGGPAGFDDTHKRARAVFDRRQTYDPTDEKFDEQLDPPPATRYLRQMSPPLFTSEDAPICPSWLTDEERSEARLGAQCEQDAEELERAAVEEKVKQFGRWAAERGVQLSFFRGNVRHHPSGKIAPYTLMLTRNEGT